MVKTVETIQKEDDMYTSMDAELIKALEDETNGYLFDLTTDKLNQQTKKLLNELRLPRETERDLVNKLKFYKFAESVDDIKQGSFIRWIQLDDFSLSNGAIYCNLVDNETIQCKTFVGRHFQLYIGDCLVFQKLTRQELIILSAMDHLSYN